MASFLLKPLLNVRLIARQNLYVVIESGSMVKSLKVILGITSLLFCSVGTATVISGSHTTDGGKAVALQGLEWLSLDHTAGISRTQVESAGGFTDRYGTHWNPGDWRYATRAETETLLGSIWGGTYSGLAYDNADGARWFLSMFGGLAFDLWVGNVRTDRKSDYYFYKDFDYAHFFFGNDGECTADATQSCVGEVSLAGNTTRDLTALNVEKGLLEPSVTQQSGEAGWFSEYAGLDAGFNSYNSFYNKTGLNYYWGQLLVRASTVPEPSALVLMLLGLLSLGYLQRKGAA